MKDVVMSPGDEYSGWLKWIAKNKRGGVVTFPTRAGQEALKIGLKALRGEPVPHGVIIPSVYLDTAASIKALEANRPDDWWASTLPDAWKPK